MLYARTAIKERCEFHQLMHESGLSVHARLDLHAKLATTSSSPHTQLVALNTTRLMQLKASSW